MITSIFYISIITYIFIILIHKFYKINNWFILILLLISFLLILLDFNIQSSLLWLFFILFLTHSYFGIGEIINDYIHNNFIRFILINYVIHIINITTIFSFCDLLAHF